MSHVSGLRNRKRHRPELPLVPLIDVLVMLVLFAFVTMRFAASTALNITLPKAETAGKNRLDNNEVIISVDKDGRISFNGKVTSDENLLVLLKQVKDISREIPVLISADQKATMDRTTYIMDSCNKAGLHRFRLQTRN